MDDDTPPHDDDDEFLDFELDAVAVDEEPAGPIFAVTNPPGTVTVSTFMDGRVRGVELSKEAASMTEIELADEIVVIARLATQDARAAQYEYVLDDMRRQGQDDAVTRDFLSRDLDLPSPEVAMAARAEVFAMRYAGDHD